MATRMEDENTDEEDDSDELEGTDWSGTEDEEDDDDNATCIQSEVVTDQFDDLLVELPDIHYF